MGNLAPFIVLLALPAVAGLSCLALRSLRAVFAVLVSGVLLTAAFGVTVIFRVAADGPFSAASDWLRVDALSAFNLGVMLLVFVLSSLFAAVYFRDEAARGAFDIRSARTFAALWCGSLSSMTLVLVSDNLAVMWVGIEATTLLTAFLINVHPSREALEAMWKYILICSVGVAFAFMGTLLAAASARGILEPAETLLWTRLAERSALLDPILIKAAFIFVVVGYGTKAGLAPMHNWLPDAHSQAPAPVSAVFSGFMLNAAIYCVLRYLPIVEGATGGTGWGRDIMVAVGLFSIVLAGAFILFQGDLKRLLAYCSVEHVGIIALGFGLGGLGAFAALFHTLNHSLGKTLAFFSAGRLGQRYGTHSMSGMGGSIRTSRVWGIGLLGGMLALIGVAPLAVFMSEFQTVRASLESGSAWITVIFLGGMAIAFSGMLGRAIHCAWGASSGVKPLPLKKSFLEPVLVVAPLLALLVLGIWMPDSLKGLMSAAASVVRGADPVIGAITGGGVTGEGL